MQEAINLHHLFVFSAVARTGSFTRAADELFITQPAVSKQVRQLEHDLRTDLIEQIGRRIFLTEAGELLADYAANIFSMASDARRAMVELQDLERGTLTIAASETIGMYLLPEVTRGFLARYPGVALRIRIMNTTNVAESVMSYDAEIGFIEGPVESSSLVLDDIAMDELVLVAAPGSPLGHGQFAHPAMLHALPFILRESGSGTRAVADAFLEAAAVVPRIVAEIDNIEAIKRVVAAGLGCTVLSRAAVSSDVAAGQLIVRRLAGAEMARPLRVATLAQRRLSIAAREFVAMASGEIPRMLTSGES